MRFGHEYDCTVDTHPLGQALINTVVARNRLCMLIEKLL